MGIENLDPEIQLSMARHTLSGEIGNEDLDPTDRSVDVKCLVFEEIGRQYICKRPAPE